MNIAVMLAGGVGRRMGSETPKQFLNVLGKPVIVHTLEVFQNNPNIDAIEVVTVESYISEVESYREKYGIDKLKWIVSGGDTCQESIRNGIFNLEGYVDGADNILIVMSVAPLISDEVIDDSLRVCNKYGNAVAGSYSIYNFSTIHREVEDVEKKGDSKKSLTDKPIGSSDECVWANNYIYKEDHVTLNMPWTFPMEKLLWAYKKAFNEGIGTDVRAYTTTLMVDLGEKLYFSKDTQKNKLKLTTLDDVDMLEGYLLVQELRKGNTEAATTLYSQYD